MSVAVTRLVEDQGTIVVFEGTTENGNTIWFGADHRPAQDIADALQRGEAPEVEVEGWQVIGGAA